MTAATPLFVSGTPYPLTEFGGNILPPTQYIRGIATAHTNHCIDLDIVGNTLYLCAGWSGLGIYDITDRSNPIEIATVSSAQLNAISGVRVRGNYAFCACEQSESLTVIDLTTRTVVSYFHPWSNPVAPETAGSFTLAGACSIVLNAAGTLAYISCITRHNLAVIDISVPTAPRFLSEVRSYNGANGFWMAGCRDVVINEAAGVAYIACEYTNNIVVADISDPNNAHIITTIGNASNQVQRGLTLNEAKTRLYVAGSGFGHGGMDIWNVSNPRAPVAVKVFQGTTTANFYGARGVVVNGNYAYLCSEYGNMFIIVDISNELSPVVAVTERGPPNSLAEMLWMRVQDGYAYIAQFGATNSGLPPGNALSVIQVNPPYTTAVGT